MQVREPMTFARSPLEALLARGDDTALDWLADRLLARDGVVPAEAPAPTSIPEENDELAEG
jgi:hypothetical protein